MHDGIIYVCRVWYIDVWKIPGLSGRTRNGGVGAKRVAKELELTGALLGEV